MAISDDRMLALGSDLLGWRTDTPAGMAKVLADLELLQSLHQRTRLAAETLTEELTRANPRHENT